MHDINYSPVIVLYFYTLPAVYTIDCLETCEYAQLNLPPLTLKTIPPLQAKASNSIPLNPSKPSLIPSNQEPQ